MTRRLWTLFVVPVLLAAAFALAACGGDDGKDGGGSSANAGDLLRSAFSKTVDSGKLEVDVKADVKGGNTPAGPFSFKLSGPFASNGDKLPKLDMEMTVGGGGISLQGGLVSTGDNAFVEFRGAAYEVGKEIVAQFNQQLEKNAGQNSAAELGIDPVKWVKDPEVDGGGEIGGDKTTKVSGDVDIDAMLTDLEDASKKADADAEELTDEQRDQVTDAVKQASVEVHVADDGGTLRRFVVELEVEVPEEARSEVGGVESGKLTLDMKLTDVGKDVTVETPSDARPLVELLGQFGLGQSGALPFPRQ